MTLSKQTARESGAGSNEMEVKLAGYLKDQVPFSSASNEFHWFPVLHFQFVSSYHHRVSTGLEAYVSIVKMKTLYVIRLALAAVFSFSLSLVSAVPLGLDDITPEIVEHLGKRTLQNPPAGLPGCDADPTWAVGKSNWTDGQGVAIGSDCDNHKGGNNHCW
jgi:hypothetical protein